MASEEKVRSFNGRLKAMEKHIDRMTAVVQAVQKTTSDLANRHNQIAEVVNALALHTRELPNNPNFLLAMVDRLQDLLTNGTDALREKMNSKTIITWNPATLEEVEASGIETSVVKAVLRLGEKEGEVTRVVLSTRVPGSDGEKFAWFPLTDADIARLQFPASETIASFATAEPGTEHYYLRTVEVVPVEETPMVKRSEGVWMEIPPEDAMKMDPSEQLVMRVTLETATNSNSAPNGILMRLVAGQDGGNAWLLLDNTNPQLEGYDPTILDELVQPFLQRAVENEPMYFVYLKPDSEEVFESPIGALTEATLESAPQTNAIDDGYDVGIKTIVCSGIDTNYPLNDQIIVRYSDEGELSFHPAIKPTETLAFENELVECYYNDKATALIARDLLQLGGSVVLRTEMIDTV